MNLPADFSPEAVFDEESDWNIEREALEDDLLSAAEKLLRHSQAEAITLVGEGFEVLIRYVDITGTKQ